MERSDGNTGNDLGPDPQSREQQRAGASSPPTRRWLLPVTLVALVGIVVGFIFLTPRQPGPTNNQGPAALATQPGSAATPQPETKATQPPVATPTPLPIAARVGALAPDFTFNDVYTTTEVTLSSLRGQPVWINFWASWCAPCWQEMPDIQAAYDAHKAEGLHVIGLNLAEGTQRAREYAEQKGYNYTFAVDWDEATALRYGVQGIPVSVFVDRDGVIRTLNVGPMAPGAMETALQTILAK